MILINLKNWFWKFLHDIDRTIAHFLRWFILQARPFFGPPAICPFKIGCTQLTLIYLEQYCIPVALWHSGQRLIRCNPVWFWWSKD